MRNSIRISRSKSNALLRKGTVRTRAKEIDVIPVQFRLFNISRSVRVINSKSIFENVVKEEDVRGNCGSFSYTLFSSPYLSLSFSRNFVSESARYVTKSRSCLSKKEAKRGQAKKGVENVTRGRAAVAGTSKV